MGGGGGSTDIDETPQERELARVMTEQYGFAQEQVIPMIEDYKTRSKASSADYDRAEGAAGGAAGSAFDEARTNVETSNRNRGAAPTSGSALTTAADLSAREGTSRAGRGVDAVNETTQREYTGLQNVVAMGSGKPAQAQRGFTAMAGNAVQDAVTDAREAQYQNEARASNVGTAVGMGVRGWEASSNSGGSNHTSAWQRRQGMDNNEFLTTPYGGG